MKITINAGRRDYEKDKFELAVLTISKHKISQKNQSNMTKHF